MSLNYQHVQNTAVKPLVHNGLHKSSECPVVSDAKTLEADPLSPQVVRWGLHGSGHPIDAQSD